MKHHKYYNTIWTNRDQEFWWDGIKSGFIGGTSLSIVLCAGTIMLINDIKSKQIKKKES